MSMLLITVGIFVAILLGLLVWAVSRRDDESGVSANQKENLTLACKHLTNLPQIRQALEPSDLTYIVNRAKTNRGIAATVRQERRRIALHYLESLREDFDQLIEAAQVVAALSPRVEAVQEWKRFRLTLEFGWKYQLVRARFAVGLQGFTALSSLALLVSSLALDMERAVAELGEAALKADNFSSPAE